MDPLEITRADEWHHHLRDGAMLARVLPYTARTFGRAIVMPNLSPVIATVEDARAYRSRILEALLTGVPFEPLMTLYLTDTMTIAEIESAAAASETVAVKFYPKGATTHSESGVEGLDGLTSILEALERTELPLWIHGEDTAADCDIFDPERVFLDERLCPLIERHPRLRVVVEHITTAEAARFVSDSSPRVAATITPQHLLMNRNALFEGGLRPHHYCRPILKRESDRRGLVAAAVSGDPSFFLGTDSAPHERSQKESACGCAGVFSAPVAIEAYAEAFAEVEALDRLEGFASFHGADYYGLPRNADRIRLDCVDWQGPDHVGVGEDALQVFWSGRSFRYRQVDTI